mgnify:CR=1 FL=1
MNIGGSYMKEEKKSNQKITNWLAFYFRGISAACKKNLLKDIDDRTKSVITLIGMLANIVPESSRRAIKWKQGNGSVINIEDMTTDHIHSCISFIKGGRIKKNTEIENLYWIIIFQSEIDRRSKK